MTAFTFAVGSLIGSLVLAYLWERWERKAVEAKCHRLRLDLRMARIELAEERSRKVINAVDRFPSQRRTR
jgi:hypothetical protein